MLFRTYIRLRLGFCQESKTIQCKIGMTRHTDKLHALRKDTNILRLVLLRSDEEKWRKTASGWLKSAISADFA